MYTVNLDVQIRQGVFVPFCKRDFVNCHCFQVGDDIFGHNTIENFKENNISTGKYIQFIWIYYIQYYSVLFRNSTKTQSLHQANPLQVVKHGIPRHVSQKHKQFTQVWFNCNLTCWLCRGSYFGSTNQSQKVAYGGSYQMYRFYVLQLTQE